MKPSMVNHQTALDYSDPLPVIPPNVEVDWERPTIRKVLDADGRIFEFLKKMGGVTYHLNSRYFEEAKDLDFDLWQPFNPAVYSDKVNFELIDIFKKASDSMVKAKEQAAKRYNQNRRDISYKVNDLSITRNLKRQTQLPQNYQLSYSIKMAIFFTKFRGVPYQEPKNDNRRRRIHFLKEEVSDERDSLFFEK